MIMLLWVSIIHASECPEHYYNQVVPVVNVPASVELCMDKFVVLYDTDRKSPIWSAEFLSKEDVIKSRAIPRKDDFHGEKRLPSDARTKNSDYISSGYDKGHLTPYRDKSFSVDIDSLANVAPQSPTLNRGVWAQLEDSVRDFVLENGGVYVLTGVVLGKEPRGYIGKNVPIPTHYFKMVVFPATNTITVYVAENTSDAMIAFWDITQLESLSGVTFSFK